jgi:hypothetical protein
MSRQSNVVMAAFAAQRFRTGFLSVRAQGEPKADFARR